jgi:CBS domain-containing protein
VGIILMDYICAYNFSSKDILMRVIAQNLSPSSTLVETVYLDLVLFGITFLLPFSSPFYLTYIKHNLQVMTANPECAIVDTPIVDALHIMHNGKFLHLPVVDRGNILA